MKVNTCSSQEIVVIVTECKGLSTISGIYQHCIRKYVVFIVCVCVDIIILSVGYITYVCGVFKVIKLDVQMLYLCMLFINTTLYYF